jgi:rhodanese-related sulfurtransferase
MSAIVGLDGRSQKIIAGFLVFTLLLAFVMALPSLVEAQESTPYANISVDTAHEMIKHGDSSNLVILDVRNQSEYNLDHLYGAILIPVYQLEARISELEKSRNDPIIVYCKSGFRSQMACEILVEHNFTKVYNMAGGILAWIEAGYPIDTSYHQVTVDVVDNRILLQIEPLLLYHSGCACFAQNTKVTVSGPNVTVLERTENHTVTLITYEINGTLFEYTSAKTLLWSDTESTHESNKTIKLESHQITAEGKSIQFYSLRDVVQDEEYNMTVYTILDPLDPETYNSSFTFMNYAPAGETNVTSLEFVKFNCSATLSQQYDVLGKVAKEMKKVYKKSEDDNVTALAGSYRGMSKEAAYLSKLVKKRLTQYDHPVLHSSAVLIDCGPLGPPCLDGGGGGGGCDWVCYFSWSALCYLGCAALCILWVPFCAFLAYCGDYGCAVAVQIACGC